MNPERKSFGKVHTCAHGDTALDLTFDKGCGRFEVLGPCILRLRLTLAKKLGQYGSYAIEKEIVPLPFTAVKTNGGLAIHTGFFSALINTSQFSVSMVGAKNKIISAGNPFTYEGNRIFDTRLARQHDDFFGLGERITPFGRRGYRCTNWNTDNANYHNETNERMYVSLPFMLVSGNGLPWGYFLDSSYETHFDLGCADWDQCEISTKRGEFTLYLIAGKTAKDVLSAYASLTGAHSMPPLWALGYHQCRWSYMSTDEAMTVAKNLRKRQIPCDTLWYDIDYMDNFRVFTVDKKRFKNMKQHLAATKKLGFHSVVIVDPGVKIDEPGVYNVLDKGTTHNYFLKTPGHKDYVGKVWPGGTKFPDFSNPAVRTWWAGLHKRLYDLGVDGFWNDMNEPADFNANGTVPEDLKMFDTGRWSTMDRMHNVYATFEAKATIEGMLKLRPDNRPFLLTRAGFAGIQKYAAIWCGDNTSTWGHLKASIPQLLNMGMSGIGFVGVDVGGFSGNANPELLARWTQAGCLYPFFRNHTAAGTINQEPWAFGAEVESICRQAIRLRYHLLPYFYQLFHSMHKNGVPVMRPMFLEFENDPHTHNLGEQFMVGPSLLAAPVLDQGKVHVPVYFPKGTWYDYATGEHYAGGGIQLVKAPLEKLPLFVRASAVLPVMPVVDATRFMDKTTLGLEVFAGTGNFTSLVHEDDMETNAYLTQGTLVHAIRLTSKGLDLALDPKTAYTKIYVRVFQPSLHSKTLSGFKKKGLWCEKIFPVAKNLTIALA
ncbi:MAG: hypothetical protein A2268_03285 [Candidatus Raymondbacteria bacterium RifOxyA12_full_50_37]|uniref:Uncharacterized protein n=1 Tax=Candidatus Raymondbacteria bacterium RIFOXYD12_FULL_49_13 TaxID=1817890 RepID=A0A1F7FHK6_UNCRA|nr:MAG: hypothetical protein A2268_03285 [Candidatus Raymondbacteria bacterium RifOxyA12_full_50_37]OGJ87462.1 MAG: hypothetical protein A2248_22025 [Candidatus Raymondbacteria bacterium RIFOXYA2_FULL_49_16]OGJ96402.1 MAG: hypothetical protein A2453_01640 [Candidatus Raymondbacteria bacterium RIFOXYC2_FULL_50_21]OGK03561.1 MAG: hypothetical protein A2350_09830 [Candidatus Raymondbacteria bacterium RifOxyB12_full_50_8]OGK06160.1 MAG: hypothetical protein A2519_22630 [Candidatus Raymondbacteria b